MKLQSVGSRCWVPLLVSSFVASAAGQVGIAVGIIPCYLPQASAQAVGACGVIAAALAVRLLGLATAARENEAAARERAQVALQHSEKAARRNDERRRERRRWPLQGWARVTALVLRMLSMIVPANGPATLRVPRRGDAPTVIRPGTSARLRSAE